MRHELKRVHPLRAANVGALVYGLFTGVVAILLLPFFLLMAAFAPAEEVGALGSTLAALLIVVLYPILGLVIGWLTGLLMSAIYNFIIRWTGGLLVDFESPPAGPSSGTI